MSKPDDVLTAVRTALLNDSTLSGYVKNFFFDKRAQMVLFPAICVEFLSDNEKDLTFGTQDITMNIGILAVIKCDNKDIQLVGDGTTKGILDVINDIKHALSADRTFGGKALYTRITTTTKDESAYPIVAAALALEIQYRQNTFTRT